VAAHLRGEGIPPAAKYISHPIDTDARYGRKSTTTSSWVGYRVHLTETCEEGAPKIITDVQTAPAPVADGDATPIIHEALKEKNLLPETQFVDTGYLDAGLLAQSERNYGVDLFGPTRRDHRGKARAKRGFGAQDFRHTLAVGEDLRGASLQVCRIGEDPRPASINRDFS
jgi:transposase